MIKMFICKINIGYVHNVSWRNGQLLMLNALTVMWDFPILYYKFGCHVKFYLKTI